MIIKRLFFIYCIICFVFLSGNSVYSSAAVGPVPAEGKITDSPGEKNAMEHENTENGEPEFFFLPPIGDKDLFESVNDLSICRNKYVREYIYQYLTIGREFLIYAIARSNRYSRIVEEIFNENSNIPEDISLLPLLESGFNPYARSRSKAVGLWQFMKGTSRELGLKTNKWVDERRDIEKSTKAAIKHLNGLHRIFNSWELALTAYNGGASYVKKAMIKCGADTFRELVDSGALHRETSEFVYRFAALLIIYKNQELFDIESDIPEEDHPETENIVLRYPVSISRLAEVTDVPSEIIKKYNPELKKNTTPPYEKDYTIRMPRGSKEIIERNKSRLYVVKYKKLRKHIVRKGECISKIAALYKTRSRNIIIFNNIKNPNLIRPGMELYIPI